jgi:hypothetical protein
MKPLITNQETNKPLFIDELPAFYQKAEMACTAIDNWMFTKIEDLVANGNPHENREELVKMIWSAHNTAKSLFVMLRASFFAILIQPLEKAKSLSQSRNERTGPPVDPLD